MIRFAVVAAATLALGLASPAEAGIRKNGLELNGIRKNGLELNGIRWNGTAMAPVVALRIEGMTLRDGTLLRAAAR